MACLSRHPAKLQIVVPYIGAIPGFKSISSFSSHVLEKCDCSFKLITRPPSARPLSLGQTNLLSLPEAEIIANWGVDLMIRHGNPLHSKIYQFTFHEGDRAAFVGSANFSMGGFERNHETMAYLDEKGDNDEVAKEIDLIADGAYNFARWRVISAKQSSKNPNRRQNDHSQNL